MKRMICSFLVCSLFLFLCSCGTAQDKNVGVVSYFYRTAETEYNAQNGILTAEMRDVPGNEADFQYLIEQYLNGPTIKGCISPFPNGTTLKALNVEDNKVQITLSNHLSFLSGSELIIACICITKTVIDMTGVTSVQICSEEGLLNGEDSLTLTANSFVLLDMGADYIKD